LKLASNCIIKIPPHMGLYLLFCIASNCLEIDKVDLSEVLVLGRNFTCQYAIRFGNTEMEFIANIESKMMAAELIT